MAWNGSDSEKIKKEGQERKDKLRSSTSTLDFNRKALCACLLVILVGGIVAWLTLDRSPTSAGPKVTKQPSAQIQEVTPAKPKPAEVTEKPKAKKTQAERDAEFIRQCEREYGDNMPAGLKTHLYYLKNPPKQVSQGMLSFPYLKHTSERDIATLLSVEPGTFMLNPMEFGPQFDEDFIAALVDPIRAEPDDSDDIKEEKRQIEAMKKEVAALVRSTGKKPSELMTEHSQLMYDLGRFEQQLAENLREAESNPNLTDDDVKDYFAAANELRKKKGLEERAIPSLTERTLELKREAKLRMLKQREEAEKEDKQ